MADEPIKPKENPSGDQPVRSVEQQADALLNEWYQEDPDARALRGGRGGRTMNERERKSEFRLGIMWAAWWLHSGYGEDSLAARLIRESLPISAARKIARDEDYTFTRGFWSQSELR